VTSADDTNHPVTYLSTEGDVRQSQTAILMFLVRCLAVCGCTAKGIGCWSKDLLSNGF